MSLSTYLSPDARKQYLEIYEAGVKRWPVPYADRYINTRFGRTHVIVAGPEDAPPLVLLHGFMATNLMWDSHIAELSRHYRCYSVQAITDVGRSEQTAPVTDIPDYVTWLRDLFAGLGLSKARVMGLSYGGFLATALTIHAPELVERAVLLCPAGSLDPLSPQFLLRAMPGMITKSRRLLRWYWAWFLADKRNLNHPGTDLFVEAWLTFKMAAPFVQPGLFTDDELRSIRVPTTVIIGEHEVIYKSGPKATLERAKRLIPGVRTHLLPGAGHVLTLDNPSESGRLMLEALA